MCYVLLLVNHQPDKILPFLTHQYYLCPVRQQHQLSCHNLLFLAVNYVLAGKCEGLKEVIRWDPNHWYHEGLICPNSHQHYQP